MIKKITGLKLTPAEFRKLERCVTCLKASDIKLGQKCESCLKIDYKFCSKCESILREGLHIFYGYDNTDNHRESEFDFLVSKSMIREFVFEETLPPLQSPTVCNRCLSVGDSGMKDICFWCGNDFYNDIINYKLNGNTCEECESKFEKQGLNNKKEIRL